MCISNVLDKVRQALAAAGQKATIILLDENSKKSSKKVPKYLVLGKIMKEDVSLANFVEHPPRGKDELGMVLWSSGSTGNPKGIKIPLRALLALVMDSTRIIEANGNILMGTWMFHFGGFIMPLLYMGRNTTMIYLQPNMLQPKQMLEAIVSHDCSTGICSYHDVIRLSKCQPDSSINLKGFTGIMPVGAKLPIESYLKLKKIFPNLETCPDVYGATETGLVYQCDEPGTGGKLSSYAQVEI